MTEPRQPESKRPQSPMGYMSLGFELAAPVMLLTYGGYWLDGRLGTLPWFLLLGLLLGMAAGFYNLFRRVL